MTLPLHATSLWHHFAGSRLCFIAKMTLIKMRKHMKLSGGFFLCMHINHLQNKNGVLIFLLGASCGCRGIEANLLECVWARARSMVHASKFFSLRPLFCYHSLRPLFCYHSLRPRLKWLLNLIKVELLDGSMTLRSELRPYNCRRHKTPQGRRRLKIRNKQNN